MPMLDIQKRHAEVFRIRLGDKAASGAPRKLTDSIRVTSPNGSVVAAFADVFGGEPRGWAGGEGQQFEVYLPVTELPVMILPGESIQQWWELWKSRNEAVCERRCDGYVETLTGRACMCPDDITVRMQTAGACRPMTRLSVVCPDVAVIGAGSLVSHGMIAAQTLPQSVKVAQAALERGLMVPAVFRVVEHKGKRHYIVPQLEIVGVSLHQLTTGEASVPALGNGHKEIAPPPVAALGSGGGEGAREVAQAPASDNGPRRPANKPPLRKRSGADDKGSDATDGTGPASPEEIAELSAMMSAVPIARRLECSRAFRDEFGPVQSISAAKVPQARLFVAAFCEGGDDDPDRKGGTPPSNQASSEDDQPGGLNAPPATNTDVADSSQVIDGADASDLHRDIARIAKALGRTKPGVKDPAKQVADTVWSEAVLDGLVFAATNGRTCDAGKLTREDAGRVNAYLLDVEAGRMTVELEDNGNVRIVVGDRDTYHFVRTPDGLVHVGAVPA